MSMRNRLVAIFSLGFVLTLAIAGTASALDNVAKISVSQDFASDITEGDRVVGYVLETVTEGAPLPSGAIGKDYFFELEDDEAKEIEIPFTDTGTYEYLLKCVEEPRDGYTFDAREYKLMVKATVGSHAAEIIPLVYDESDEKVDKVEWKAEYSYKGDDEDENSNANANENAANGNDNRDGSPSGMPSTSTPSGTTPSSNSSNIPKMEDVIPWLLYAAAAAAGCTLIVAAVKRRKKDEEEGDAHE